MYSIEDMVLFFVEDIQLCKIKLCSLYSVIPPTCITRCTCMYDLKLGLSENRCNYKKITLDTHIYFRGAADNILDFSPVDSKCVHEHTRIEVPEFDRKVRASGEKVVRVVGLTLRVRVKEAVHLALVTLHDAVLWPTCMRVHEGGDIKP